MKINVVVDVQNDFIDGSLGTIEAQQAMKHVIERVAAAKENDEVIIFTQDTHDNDYLDTPEGQALPVKHCIRGTHGHAIPEPVDIPRCTHILKKTFGSIELANTISKYVADEIVSEIILFGFCTDICVISNALILKAAFPKTKISVYADACAGTTYPMHLEALDIMKACQINVVE